MPPLSLHAEGEASELASSVRGLRTTTLNQFDYLLVTSNSQRKGSDQEWLTEQQTEKLHTSVKELRPSPISTQKAFQKGSFYVRGVILFIYINSHCISSILKEALPHKQFKIVIPRRCLDHVPMLHPTQAQTQTSLPGVVFLQVLSSILGYQHPGGGTSLF